MINKEIKHSKGIKLHLCLMMFFLIFLSIGVTALLNLFFLDDYHLHQIKNNYKVYYKELKKIVNTSYDMDIFKRTKLDYYINDIAKTSNTSVAIKYEDFLGNGYCLTYGTENKQYLNFKLSSYDKGYQISTRKIIDRYGSSTIQMVEENISYNNKKKVYEIWGRLDNMTTFLISTNVDDISETLKSSTQFFLMVGVFCAIISSAIAVYMVNRFIKPINKLTAIAKEMSNMNFDVKYKDNSLREIDQLGNNFNDMSAKLESYISELKTKNYKLRQAITKRDEIDNMRKEFISNVSHELKTPIALIGGYAEGLKYGIGDATQEDRDFYCDVIMDETNRMDAMVKDLLLLMELEFGNQNFEMERFDIVEFIKSLAESFRLYEEQKDLKIEFVGAEKPIMVWSDKSKMDTVFRNYIKNAFNHVDDNKKIVITFKIKEDVKRVRIGVFNTGMPIPTEIKSRIWEKFYKVDKARTRAYGGNGIGLSIVKAILDRGKKAHGVVNRSNGVEFFVELDMK